MEREARRTSGGKNESEFIGYNSLSSQVKIIKYRKILKLKSLMARLIACNDNDVFKVVAKINCEQKEKSSLYGWYNDGNSACYFSGG